ncbi:hypothetical protein MAA8898_05142 [Maliponia aquimaris]|uniref:Transposase DDE domain-containing protein n=1 Tax=Maliponia aquimaris TaxID=1673631 RepID=A0A238L773_9RHOB|nr:hypothetical protein MAA8898_05142 [Maliponia aquimaris]
MTWHAPHEGRPGRPPVFSNSAIQFCLSIKVLFRLPLRQTAGMVVRLRRLAGLDWPVPDYSTQCRRQKTLKMQIPYRRADGPLHLLVPSRDISSKCPAGCPAAKARNETLRATRHYGRAFWKRWTGYHARSRVEAKMRCLKAFSERIAARDHDRQTAEIHIRVALVNRFNALGTAEVVRVA